MTGTLTGTLDLGGSCAELTVPPAAIAGTLYVAKLDASGSCAWAEAFGDGEAQSGFGIALDATGNPWVTGLFSGTLDTACGALTGLAYDDPGCTPVTMPTTDTPGAYWTHQFLMALSASDGELLWLRDIPAGDAPSLARNDVGQMLLTGGVWGSPDLGQGPLPDTGGAEVMYVAKFDTH